MHKVSSRVDYVVKAEQKMQTAPGNLPQGIPELCFTCQTQLLCHSNHGWQQYACCSFSICGTATTETSQHCWLQGLVARLQESHFCFRPCTVTCMVTLQVQFCRYPERHAVQRGLYLAVTAAALLP